MRHRVFSVVLGIFGVSAFLAPLSVDGFLASVLPFFRGFGPDFVRHLGLVYFILPLSHEFVLLTRDKLSFKAGLVVATVTAGLVTVVLILAGIEVAGNGDIVIILAYTLPYLFAISRTIRHRLTLTLIILIPPFIGYYTYVPFAGESPLGEAIVFTLIGILFGIPLALLGWTTDTK